MTLRQFLNSKGSRYVIAGGLNTGITYLIYLLLAQFVNYQVAYLIAYVLGIGLAYVLNARYVFQTPLNWLGFFTFPTVYVVQYIARAILLAICVEVFRINVYIAPLLVIVFVLPLTYLFTKFVLERTSSQKL